ncbi:MAG: DUF1513 domain-containing protein [Gammaproteobacteria bacterium]|nr:DUF1513 domain-containing protein [Gammaproteobacteria bacterium]
MQRRTFLAASLAAVAGSAVLGWRWWSQERQPVLLSARDNAQGEHFAVGYTLAGEQLFATQVTARCHDICVHPSLPLALFTGRRPSTESYLIDLQTGRLLQTLVTPANRHFQGHAVFDARGERLYSTENDTDEPGRGVIGVWQLDAAQRLQRIDDLSSHGVGPHQLLWLPDGKTLVVANGGIRTESGSREELNLDAMEPSLVLMNAQGELLSKEFLADSMNSIRHLAVADDGTVIAVQQYQGALTQRIDLLAIKRPQQALQVFPVAEAQRSKMQQYAASVAIHNELRLVAMTAPRGGRMFIWDLDSAELRLDAPFPDCAGVVASAEGFVVTTGVGRCRAYDCRSDTIRMQALNLPTGLWDNHAVML